MFSASRAPGRVGRGACAIVLSWLLLSAVPTAASAGRAEAGHDNDSGTPPPPPDGLTFNRDIAPIIWARCAPCHRPGEIGPFSLIAYEDVRRRATQIARVTARRLMPPWKPEQDRGVFQDERGFAPGELEKIQRWIAEGLARGDPRDLPPVPAWPEGWRLGTPDLVVEMPEPFAVRADGPDVFRTFVIPIPLTAPRYVRAIEFRPGNARVVHHANLGIDRTRSSRMLDARDPEPGYVGGMVRDARYPEGQMLGWTPGQAPHASPEGMAWRLEPGSDFVAQLHLQPTGKPERLQLSVGFFFTDSPPVRAPLGLRLGSETIDIPAGTRDYVVADEYVLPVDVEVLAVQPHAHNLARRMEARATLPGGATQPLIAIADWDFRWQDVYRYAKPIALPKGTTIAMRYEYDNSSANARNPHHPPARVVWGQNTSDEMGDLWLQLVPRSTADFARLERDVRRKTLVDDLAAYDKLLEADPDNALRHDAVGDLLLQAGRLDDAIARYQRSIALNPASASTHYNLGYALSARGRRSEAIAQFRAALAADPDYAQAHNNLGALLQLDGQIDEARAHFERAVALRPDSVDALTNLALLLSKLGEPAAAIGRFREALVLDAANAQALSGLAWIRATAADASLRDSSEAIALAHRAAAAGPANVAALDALAAAYASAARFDEAVAAARSAIEVATSTGQNEAVDQLRLRLQRYLSHERP
jgi:tetratricopeptide (TPR) repeat protein